MTTRADTDAEARALHALADAIAALPARRGPDADLQVVVDLARTLTGARYAALAVTDRSDRTQGFFVAGLDKSALRGLKGPPQGHGPLGQLREDGRPVRYENVEAHRRAFGFPPRHPEMRKLMGIPLWAGGEVRGSIYVTDREDGEPFDDDDEQLLLTLGRHAGVVIEQSWY
ncbi:MAG: GAF domain-containing protein [Dehalococcoidia bacterium]|nr:GAF domain-containing protein [Dehalococcoidia bacterium]